MWMLLIDAHSKWPEVHAMDSTTTEAVIKHLQQIFVTHGFLTRLCQTMVPNLWQRNLSSSVCLMAFTTPQQIHITLALMMRLNDLCRFLSRVWIKPTQYLQDCVLNFLARYRATPHLVTDQTPSEMLNNR